MIKNGSIVHAIDMIDKEWKSQDRDVQAFTKTESFLTSVAERDRGDVVLVSLDALIRNRFPIHPAPLHLVVTTHGAFSTETTDLAA